MIVFVLWKTSAFASTGFAEGIVYAEVDVEHDIQNAKESYYDLQKRRHPEVYRKEIE